MDEIAKEIEGLDSDQHLSFHEDIHIAADELLLKALAMLGAQSVVDAYRKKAAEVDFCYS